MDTLQLKSIITKDKFAKKSFCGVIPIDYLPKTKLLKTCSFIVNTEDSSKSGKHWIAVYAPLRGSVEYFDPFGLEPSKIEILDFIKLNKKRFIFNPHQIQASSSYNCGLFCIFYILLRSRGISMLKTLKFFSEISNLNDEIIKVIFKKLNLRIKIKYLFE